jgi:hypothetical protein
MTECSIMSDIAEIQIAQAWNSLQIPQPFRTSDNRTVRVIYPGVWTHGLGPDFRGAMLDFDGRLVSGDVEVEVRSSGWFEHGHERNPAFDDVVLQVVLEDDLDSLARTSGARLVPRLILPSPQDGTSDRAQIHHQLRPLGAIGFEPCAPDVAVRSPELIRNIWERAGDRRMQNKVTAMSGELSLHPPSQVLYAGVLDALGFSRNREPMAEIAARMPIDQLIAALSDRAGIDRFWTTAGLLLGIGGFLPLSPGYASIGRLEPDQTGRVERAWRESGAAWHGLEVSPGLWSMARVRPAGHPIRRLLSGAVILSSDDGDVVQQLVRCLGDSNPRRALVQWLSGENPWLGRDHAQELIVNVMVPFALAYGQEAEQPELVDQAAAVWESLPAGRGNTVVRATQEQICGEHRLEPGSARAVQGLLHINRQGCAQMRCYECPIAHLAVEFEAESALRTEDL